MSSSLKQKQALAYNHNDGRTGIKVYYDGTFEINGIPSKDREALAKAFIEWSIEYGCTAHHWIIPEKPPCDCGAEKAQTTHSSWCSSVASP